MAEGISNQNDDEAMLDFTTLYERFVANFVLEWARKLKWGDLSDSTVLDYGSMFDTVALFKASFPNYRKVIVMDLFKGNNPFRVNNAEKFVFFKKDISRRVNIECWGEEFEKVVSFYSFNHLKDQKNGFESLHYMMCPGGQAIILTSFKLQDYFCAKEMFMTSKWNPFSMLLNDFSAHDSHEKGLEFFKDILEEVGFEIIHLSEESIRKSLPNEQEYRNYVLLRIICLVAKLPPNLQEEFKEEYFQNMMKMCIRLETGEYCLDLTSAKIVVKVPDFVDR